MNIGKSIRRFLPGVLTLVVVFAIVRYFVVKYRDEHPGSMTVIEAQAMDMSVSGTPVGSLPVATEKVTLQRFAPTVTYTGSVVAFNDLDVFPRVTGTVTAMYVYPGQEVRAGQLVATLDSVELTSRLREAKAGMDAAMHEHAISVEERRQAVAMERSSEAKSTLAKGMLREAQGQFAVAQAAREQADRETEAAQASMADAEANVTAMQADADYWASEIQREAKLHSAGAVSTEEYQREVSQGKSAQAKLAQAKAGVTEKKASIAAAKSKIQQAVAGVASAQAKVDQARAGIAGSEADVSSAKAGVDLNVHHTAHRDAMAEQSAAQARTAEIIKGYTEIRASGPGVVTERLVSPGTLVQPGMALLKIKGIDQVRLQANVAEADLAGIRVGSTATVTRPSDSAFRIQARITSVFHAANPQSRTTTVEALIANPGHRLLPGEFISMEIATSTPRTLLTVPASAVQRDGEQKPFVWTAIEGPRGEKTIYSCVMHPEVESDQPGKCPKCGMELQPKKKGGALVAHRVSLSLGVSDGLRFEVSGGLQAGDTVVANGQAALKEGDSLAPTAWGEDGPKRLPAAAMNGSDGGMKMNHGSHSMQQPMPGMDHSKLPGMGGM